ncbi:hypothetical protein [Photobacterium leiognathi]|uniref:hypothetical protein n=1 Tax=Photobacterium leiognathi TaxID=553611 RepID=UPI0029817050|nr:hypothetical protein [Photobacterium leiognathi]
MEYPANPSLDVARRYLDLWHTLDSYSLQEKSLENLFKKFCPQNDKIEDVLLKVSALNDFYSTNIYDTYSVSKHILSLNIDEKLNQGCLDLVDEIAPIKINGTTRRFYSFTTKYCSHHRPDDYPIYDSYVEKMLMHFKKRDSFCQFKKYELKNYRRFVEIIKEFSRYYSLNEFSLREIDIYLWLAGKEYFPNRY